MPRNRQLTEARIQDAATRILSETGFEGWGINAIAREAGVDKVLIYRYFNSLDGLLESIIEATEFWPDPDSLAENSPETFLDETISRMRAEPQAWILMAHPRLNSEWSFMKRRFHGNRDQWIRGFQSRLTESVPSVQLECLASMVHSLSTTGIDTVSSHDLWLEFSPPFSWGAQRPDVEDDELPVELL